MRTLLTCTLTLLFNSLLAQWQGDTSRFLFFPDSIQLNDSTSGISYLTQPSETMIDATWQIDIKIKSGTSSSNLAYIHLASDVPSLDNNGYYITVGHTADEISLYRQDEGKSTKLIDGLDKRIDIKPMIVSIKATRTADGLWTLKSKLPTEQFYTLEGDTIDNTYLSSKFWGVKAKYTSTRAKETSFYNISKTGEAFRDNVPPRLESANVLTRHKATFHFNEMIKGCTINMGQENANTIIDSCMITALFPSSMLENDSTLITISATDTSDNPLTTTHQLYYTPLEVTHITLIDHKTLQFGLNKDNVIYSNNHVSLNNTPPDTIIQEEKVFTAIFSTTLANHSTNKLIIEGITDTNGDSIKTYTETLFYIEGEYLDIVFNELMIDPSPSIGNLPEVEYIELYNNSPYDIDMKEWHLIKGDKNYEFPSYTLHSAEYVIVGALNSIEKLDTNINKIGLPSFPTLNNTEMTLILQDKLGTIIDMVSYHNNWHVDEFKADGGFSLERIDVHNPTLQDNWTSSCAIDGGTPGRSNCAMDDNPDLEAPSIISAYAIDHTHISMTFSEPVINDELTNLDHYTLSDNIHINGVLLEDTFPTNSNISLQLATPINREQVYKLNIGDIQDQSNNSIEDVSVNIAISKLPEANDIVINELMCAPLTGEQEYVELYNTTNVPFDLSQIKITQKDSDGAWKKGQSLSNEPSIFLPHSYLVLSADKEILEQQYNINTENSINVSPMPALANEAGNIGILSINGTIIDQVNYSNEWHSPLLKDNKGVALERLNISQPSNDHTNWFSASTFENYGTPGKENSQSDNITNSDKDIAVSPTSFSPDGDGKDDFTTITISSTYEGGNARIQVFNQRGIPIIELANNALLGAHNKIRWDGTDSEGKRSPMGPYIIWVEIVTSDGKVTTKKLECVIFTRF